MFNSILTVTNKMRIVDRRYLLSKAVSSNFVSKRENIMIRIQANSRSNYSRILYIKWEANGIYVFATEIFPHVVATETLAAHRPARILATSSWIRIFLASKCWYLQLCDHFPYPGSPSSHTTKGLCKARKYWTKLPRRLPFCSDGIEHAAVVRVNFLPTEKATQN